jgi:hypothetical protein
MRSQARAVASEWYQPLIFIWVLLGRSTCSSRSRRRSRTLSAPADVEEPTPAAPAAYSRFLRRAACRDGADRAQYRRRARGGGGGLRP